MFSQTENMIGVHWDKSYDKDTVIPRITSDPANEFFG